jgi:large subunit ribosomal protein L15
MKLHDLRPAEGSRKERTRVGRGIAAGKGKTAGRGTKGQKARAGGSIPPWFEGGQTPLHVRIPKLRGFKNPFKVQYEVVNVGAIAAAVERGAFEAEAPSSSKGKSKAQITVNQDILRAVGLVRSLDKPLKILGAGELDTPLFVVADAFTGSARSKIEAAGGSVQVLEVPTKPLKAIGLEPAEAEGAPTKPAKAPKSTKRTEASVELAEASEPAAEEAPAAAAEEAPAAAAEEAEAEAADEPAETSDTTADATADTTEPEPEPEPEPELEPDADPTPSDDDAR